MTDITIPPDTEIEARPKIYTLGSGGEVVPSNGITTLDIDADAVLRSPIGLLDTAIVAGIDKDGNEYFASSYGSTAETLFLLERFKKMLLERSDD